MRCYANYCQYRSRQALEFAQIIFQQTPVFDNYFAFET